MTRCFLLIMSVFLLLCFVLSCDDDYDPNDPCTQMCEKKVECNPDTLTFGQCKSDCDVPEGEGNADEVTQACKDNALAFHNCYVNSNCEDFNAINSGKPTDACSVKKEAMYSDCGEPE